MNDPVPYCAACRGHGTGEHDDECENFFTFTIRKPQVGEVFEITVERDRFGMYVHVNGKINDLQR